MAFQLEPLDQRNILDTPRSEHEESPRPEQAALFRAEEAATAIPSTVTPKPSSPT